MLNAPGNCTVIGRATQFLSRVRWQKLSADKQEEKEKSGRGKKHSDPCRRGGAFPVLQRRIAPVLGRQHIAIRTEYLEVCRHLLPGCA